MSEMRFEPERLVRMMEKRGIGDTELAKKVGLSRTMIYYLKNGKRNTASAETIARIADALNTTVAYLLGEGEAKQPPMQKLPEPIRQLAEVAGRLSEVRREELLRIATALEALEREQPERPVSDSELREAAALAEQLRERAGGEDWLPLLEAFVRSLPRRWLIDLGDEQDLDHPTDEQ